MDEDRLDRSEEIDRTDEEIVGQDVDEFEEIDELDEDKENDEMGDR